MRDRRRSVAAGAVAAVLALSASGCGGGQTVRRTITSAALEGKTGFRPTTVAVDKGDKVVLSVHNSADQAHGFSIEGYPSVKPLVVEPGKPATVRFTASRPGSFKMFCQLHPPHQPATLVVR